MIQLQIVKTGTTTADAAPSPGEIVFPDSVHPASMIQIVLRGGFNADLLARPTNDVTAPSLRIHDNPGHGHDLDHVIWEGRADGAPRFLYAVAPTVITYTIIVCGKD